MTTAPQRDRWKPATAPALRNRRESLMPVVAAALSLRGGETLTCVGDKQDEPPVLHPLVDGFLTDLPVQRRERFTGRCPEAQLLSQFLHRTAEARTGRAARKPFAAPDARRALRGSRMTTVRIREEGDPAHGTHQPPCRSCASLLEHFGVETVVLTPGRG